MAINHKKIADLAGVSISTVSKALSGSSEISKESAERIRRLAIECGYFQEKKRRKREYCNNGSITVAILVPEILDERNSKAVTYLKNELEAKNADIAVYFYDSDVGKISGIVERVILTEAADGIVTIGAATHDGEYNIPFAGVSTENAEDIEKDSVRAVDSLLSQILADENYYK